MIVFADYAPLEEECQNDDAIELCRQCNKCGRFDEKESKEATTSEMDSKEINQVQDTIPTEQLKEFISIRERFLPLYYKTGLVSIENYSGVFLTESAFLATFPRYRVMGRGDCTPPEELFTVFEGVRFFCIR